jgi:hypothetical protein
MDPQAAWDQLLCAYAEGDWDRIEELARALSDWLSTGGFPPTVLGVAALGAEFERALAQAGCDFILDAVQSQWSVADSEGDGQ